MATGCGGYNYQKVVAITTSSHSLSYYGKNLTFLCLQDGGYNYQFAKKVVAMATGCGGYNYQFAKKVVAITTSSCKVVAITTS